MSRTSFRKLGCCLVLAAVLGCTRGSSLKTVPVKGRVTLDGKPLSGATIGFSPADPAGKSAGAVTDENGNYELTTYEGQGKEAAVGAVAGHYLVAISKSGDLNIVRMAADQDVDRMTPEQIDQLTDEQKATMARRMAPKLEPNDGGNEDANGTGSDVPARYADPSQSGLQADVVEGRTEPIDFPLTSQAR